MRAPAAQRAPRKSSAIPTAEVRSEAAWDRRAFGIALSLIVLTLRVYLPSRNFDFVKYDDPDYVTDNPHVRLGLTAGNVAWAFTTNHAGNWHPLTWLSHMLDCQLFGLNGGAQHVTNTVLHSLSVFLLFLVCWRLTGAIWSSTWIAAVFALHPLHVESVAWISERKDVLSGFFWLFAIWCYIRYTKRRTHRWYAAVLISFCLGLLSKPMVVTLPIVLLLLDVWPLKRDLGMQALLREKIPLIGLAGASSVITFLAQHHVGAVTSLDSIPFLERIGNAGIAYVTYLVEVVWPARLAVFYPMPAQFPAVEALLACALVAAISWFALRSVRRRPYFFTGWFWYLITLLPVIGLVQVGSQAHADRYTYLPSIGIFLAVALVLSELTRSNNRLKGVVAVLAAASCGVCAVATTRQLSYWRNSTALFSHALQVTTGNYIAHNGMGDALGAEGRVREALDQYREASRLRPWYAPTHVHLSQAFLADHQPEEAVREAQEALAMNSNDPDALVSLGAALLRLDLYKDAEAAYRQAISLEPDDAVAHSGMGLAMAEQGNTVNGLSELRRAVEIDPAYADGHYNLGRVHGMLGQTAEAITEFTATVQLQPESAEVHYNLGTALGNAQRLDDAIREFRLAIQLKPDYANAHLNLGRALAAAGRNAEAAGEFAEVLHLQPGSQEAREALAEVAPR